MNFVRSAAMLAVTAATLPLTAAAMPYNYSGSWPVTISYATRSDGTGCLTLSGNSKTGGAKLVFGNQTYPEGSFIVRDGIIVVSIVEPLYGQNGVLQFTAHALGG